MDDHLSEDHHERARMLEALLLLFATQSWDVDATVYDAGVQFEIDHHRKWLCGTSCGYDGPNYGWFKYEKETKLKGEPVEPHRSRLCKLIAQYSKATKVRLVLDHGAGPFTNLGKRFTCDFDGAPASVRSLDAQVVAVDPLAPFYHPLLSEFAVHNTLRTAYCPSERLTHCLGENTFDLSIIINALDHSRNALKAWTQAVRVTRIGGLACVHSMKQEATRMANKGFHQWNFDVNPDGAWVMINSNTKFMSNIDQLFDGILKPLDLARAEVIDVDEAQFLKCYRKLTHPNATFASATFG